MIRFGRHPDGAPTFVPKTRQSKASRSVGITGGIVPSVQLLSPALGNSSTLWPTRRRSRHRSRGLKRSQRRAVRAKPNCRRLRAIASIPISRGGKEGPDRSGQRLEPVVFRSSFRTPGAHARAPSQASCYPGTSGSPGGVSGADGQSVRPPADPFHRVCPFISIPFRLILTPTPNPTFRLNRSGADPDHLLPFDEIGRCSAPPPGGWLAHRRWKQRVGGANNDPQRAQFVGIRIFRSTNFVAVLGIRRPCLSGDYWMGATIPGLRGIAVGRNRCVAWRDLRGRRQRRSTSWKRSREARAAMETLSPIERRQEASPVDANRPELEFKETARGTIDDDHETGRGGTKTQARVWALGRWRSRAAGVALRSPAKRSSLSSPAAHEDGGRGRPGPGRAHTLSLHFVLADRTATFAIGKRVWFPERTFGVVGALPWSDPRQSRLAKRSQRAAITTQERRSWARTRAGGVASNEARATEDGRTLSTLGQPTLSPGPHPYYPSRRGADHDVTRHAALWLDTFSRQSLRLSRFLRACYAETNAPKGGPLYQALCSCRWSVRRWKRVGAHASPSPTRDRLIESLVVSRGRPSFISSTASTSVWRCEALDRALVDRKRGARSAARCTQAAMDSAVRGSRISQGRAETVAFRYTLWARFRVVSAPARPFR